MLLPPASSAGAGAWQGQRFNNWKQAGKSQTRGLSFHTTSGKSGHDAALEYQHHDDEWDRDQ